MAADSDRPDPISDPPAPSATPERSGAIVLARHGEPALSRRLKLDSAGYRRWWTAYEEGGILGGQTPPQALLELAGAAKMIFASSRRRAVETAQAVVADRRFVQDALFIEAPLPPPPLPGFIRLSPRSWGFVARSAWWFFGYHEGQETKRQALTRAGEASDRLEAAAKEGDVLLLAHGFFNLMVGRELSRRGWRLRENGGFRYWAMRRYERD